jgi:hypothetical protein
MLCNNTHTYMNVCTLKMGMSTLRVEESEDRINDQRKRDSSLPTCVVSSKRSLKNPDHPKSGLPLPKILAMLIPLFCPCRYPLST